jgi:mannose-6-phosphate isomerase-like protein (cupin superfamily)
MAELEKTAAQLERKSFDEADEVRTPYERGRVDVVKVGDAKRWDAKRITIQPGWRFSQHTAPVVGTEVCEVFHVKLFLNGRFGVRMRDGAEMEFGPGDIGVIGAGHDAWVPGSEPCAFIDLAEVARQTGGTP